MQGIEKFSDDLPLGATHAMVITWERILSETLATMIFLDRSAAIFAGEEEQEFGIITKAGILVESKFNP